MKDHIAKVLAEAGFHDVGPGWAYAHDERTVHCALGFGPKSRIERMTWWLELEPAPQRQSVYRDGAVRVVDAPVAIELRLEGAIDALGKRLALNRELSLGDPEFDGAVYIESDGDEATVRQILAAPELRATVLEMLRDQVSVVAVRAALGRLSAARDADLAEMKASDVRRLVNALCRVHALLPKFAAVRAGQPGPNAHQKAGMVLVLVAVLGFFAIGTISGDALIAIARSPTGIGIGGAGALGVSLIVRRAMSGSSSGFRHFFVVAIPGIAAWILWAWAILAWLGR